jgi:hypothetical protein
MSGAEVVKKSQETLRLGVKGKSPPIDLCSKRLALDRRKGKNQKCTPYYRQLGFAFKKAQTCFYIYKRGSVFSHLIQRLDGDLRWETRMGRDCATLPSRAVDWMGTLDGKHGWKTLIAHMNT